MEEARFCSDYNPIPSAKLMLDNQLYALCAFRLMSALLFNILAGCQANARLAAAQVDEVLLQAQSVSTSLVDQRRVFDSIGDKVLQVGSCVCLLCAHALPALRCILGALCGGCSSAS